MGQRRLEADVARAMDSLSQLKGVESTLYITARQAEQPPADAADLLRGDSPLEQGIEARALGFNPAGIFPSSEDPAHSSLECDLCNGLHLLYTVTKRQVQERLAQRRTGAGGVVAVNDLPQGIRVHALQ